MVSSLPQNPSQHPSQQSGQNLAKKLFGLFLISVFSGGSFCKLFFFRFLEWFSHRFRSICRTKVRGQIPFNPFLKGPSTPIHPLKGPNEPEAVEHSYKEFLLSYGLDADDSTHSKTIKEQMEAIESEFKQSQDKLAGL